MGSNLQELSDDCFALVRNDDNSGTVERLYPLRSALEVKKASEFFLRNESQLRKEHSSQERRDIATCALEKAAQFSVTLAPAASRLLEQWAQRGFTTPLHVKNAIDARLSAELDIPGDVRDGLRKLAAGFERQPALCVTTDSVTMLQTVLEQFDASYGYRPEPEHQPEKTAYAITIGDAQLTATESCCLSNGNVYAKRQLTKLSSADLIGIPRHKLAGVVSGVGELTRVDPLALAAVSEQFNAAETEILESALHRRGEEPCYRKSAADAFGVSAKSLFEIAAQAQ